MKILLLESFYATSHRQWVDGYISSSAHDIDLLEMPGRHWKWRMEHSAIHFSDNIVSLDKEYDLILSTSFTNIASLRGLLMAKGERGAWYNNVPIHVFFHENQITYPWSESDPDIILKRDNHYGWINYLSCLAADKVIFNSSFHRDDFIGVLPEFLAQFPDETSMTEIEKIRNKSHVLSIGVDLVPLKSLKLIDNEVPIIIWNHRWEYDKNPNDFFNALFKLQEERLVFEVIIAGEKYKRSPKIFEEAKERLDDRIIHFGYAKSRADYLKLLARADIMPVTSNQDFFGISAVEGIAAGCFPLLPNRLAFTEHLDRPEYERCYFDSTDGLLSKLRNAISNHLNYNPKIRSQVDKYDWSAQSEIYDSFFTGAVS